GYLEPYEAARRQIDASIDQLSLLTSDNPRQQDRIALLRKLSQSKLNELAETITLYQSGHAEDARKLVLTDRGKHTMDQIRGVVAEMIQEEHALDAQRSAEFTRDVRFSNLCILLMSVVASLGLLALAFTILLEMRNRERHASEILARESWYRITLASVGDGVIATDAGGNVQFINTVAESLLGYTLAEVHGKPVEEVFPIFNEQSNNVVENPVAKVMAEGRIVGLANHTVLKHKSGRLIPIEDSAAPIRDAQDHLIGVVLVFRDATHERKTQEVMRKTQKLAAAARLASTMAHEINNPLEAVGNLLFLAKMVEPMPAEAAQFLQRAEEELQRVSHITRQTLGFYRETAAPEATDIAELVESVVKLFTNKFRSKNIELVLDFKPTPPIYSFSGELKQVVANLLSNAADAVGPNGTIVVSIAPSADNAGVEISVVDNGPGISDQILPRLFEPFFTTKQDVGTGLGLWVVKEIAERHGGAVRVSSNHGNASGSKFTVTLPAAVGQSLSVGN